MWFCLIYLQCILIFQLYYSSIDEPRLLWLLNWMISKCCPIVITNTSKAHGSENRLLTLLNNNNMLCPILSFSLFRCEKVALLLLFNRNLATIASIRTFSFSSCTMDWVFYCCICFSSDALTKSHEHHTCRFESCAVVAIAGFLIQLTVGWGSNWNAV